MHAGDRSGVTRIDVAQEVEGFLGTQLGQQDPVGLEPQAGFEQLLGRHACHALIVLGIEQPYVVWMLIKNQLLRILNSDQALLARDFGDQRLGAGGLSGARGARDDDVAAGLHRQP